MKKLFTNTRVIDVHSPYNGQMVDILVENHKIVAIGNDLKSDKVVDLAGKIVTPGLMDLFAHFNEPGNEHKENIHSGLDSAVFGGFTDVCLIPNTHPAIDSKQDVKFLINHGSDLVSVHALGAVSEQCLGENLTEILDLNEAGAIAFTDGINPIWNTELLLKALQYVQKFDGLIINRPKDHNLSQHTHMHEGIVSTSLGLKGEPSVSEIISIKRDLDILKYAGGRLHFSQLSSAESLELIRKAKQEGLNVTCDVSISHLIFTDSDLIDYNSNLKSDPPFRTEQDRKALINGVIDGVIDVIVTAHQPQDPENKELEYDLALPGLSTMPTLFSQLMQIKDELPLEVAIERLTHGPRKVLKKAGLKIDVNQKACFSVFDEDVKWTFNDKINPSKSRNSPLFGHELVGRCFGIFNGGRFHQNM